MDHLLSKETSPGAARREGETVKPSRKGAEPTDQVPLRKRPLSSEPESKGKGRADRAASPFFCFLAFRPDEFHVAVAAISSVNNA